MNIEYASFRHKEEQYFNEITLDSLGKSEISFVDGGAYNGDTFIELSKKVDVTTAYLFEPDPENYHALVNAIRFSPRPPICLPLALAEQHGILSFNGGSGESGSISEHGTVHIAAAALDEILPGQSIDFIKLDVEGAEIQALRGAERLIRRSRPILAISLYHQPQDIWEIPEYLANLCQNYRFYIRQYYYNSFDSVLYAVPKNSCNM